MDIEYCKEIQNQEIEVLSNIFTDYFSTFYDYDGIAWKYNIKIQVDVPENFSIATLNHGNKNGKDDEFKYYPIKYLPFIDLGFEYPEEYPEKPPVVYISSIWLSQEQMFSIVKKLESEWSNGEMIIYKYYDWIKTELFNYLNIDQVQMFTDEIIDLDSAVCSRVTWEHQNDWSSLISTLPFLINYCKQEQKRQFTLQPSYECPICCCDYSPDEMILLDCLHYSCKDCTTTFCKVNIEEGTIKLLKCSHIGCEQLLDQNFIKSVVTEEEYNKYEIFLKQDKGLVKCRNCETGWGYIDYDARSSYCSQCKYCRCTLCDEKIHYGLPCYYVPPVKTGPRVEVFNPFVEQPTEPQIGLRQTKCVCKKCSGCGALLDKFDGCNKITCPYCKRILCWLCLRQINGYDHFQSGSCVLFNHDPAIETIVRPPPPPPPKIEADKSKYIDIDECGKCKNLIFRSNNNNHTSCKYCKQSVCFVCKDFIKGTSHFTTTHCPQHGDLPTRVVDDVYIANRINRINNPKPRSKKVEAAAPVFKDEFLYEAIQ